MSPGARSLAAVGPVQKKKEVASDEAEEVAGRVAPTLRGWKKRKAQNEVQTLVLIALMFAVPIAVLEAFVINAQSESIAFANKELDGYRYAVRFWPSHRPYRSTAGLPLAPCPVTPTRNRAWSAPAAPSAKP
jgi:hypothetical protein